jgi:Ca2+-binding RTX toxin-like protein
MIKRFLNGLSRDSRANRPRRCERSFAPERIEALECRDLKTVTLFEGTLSIVGTDQAEVGWVSQTGDQVQVTLNGQRYAFNASEVSEIEYFGGDGNDYFANLTAIPAVMYGEGGNDMLVAGSAGDVLDGGDGNDYLYGGAGNDTLRGGAGNDILLGMNGIDNLDGGTGSNYLTAKKGSTFILNSSSSKYAY